MRLTWRLARSWPLRLADCRTQPWVKGFKALSPQLTLADRDAKLSLFEARLAALASVRKALADEDGGYTVYVEPLAPDLYVASDIQGTLDCETFVFLKIGPNGAAIIVPAPPAFSDQCWTDAGQAGRAFGQGAFVEASDFTDPAANEQHLEITPWTGDGRGPSCRLTLTYKIDFAVTERFCGDGDICAAATPFAANIAAAHGKARPDAVPLWADAAVGGRPGAAGRRGGRQAGRVRDATVPDLR